MVPAIAWYACMRGRAYTHSSVHTKNELVVIVLELVMTIEKRYKPMYSTQTRKKKIALKDTAKKRLMTGKEKGS
jgi:hypothetical protein